MNIEFKSAEKADIKKLIEVQNKSFRDDYTAYGECPAYNETKEAISMLIDNAIVYKILKDNEIVGDIIIRQKENHNYYLRVISVIPEYQNLGIGQMALKFIENAHPDAASWDLITPFKSYRNHHFYEKMGYVKIGEYRQSDVLILFRYQKIIR